MSCFAVTFRKKYLYSMIRECESLLSIVTKLTCLLETAKNICIALAQMELFQQCQSDAQHSVSSRRIKCSLWLTGAETVCDKTPFSETNRILGKTDRNVIW